MGKGFQVSLNIEDYQAIIFDLDGTLINTEPLHEEALRRTLIESNIQYNEADLLDNYIGQTDAFVFSKLIKNASQELIHSLVILKNKILFKVINDYPNPDFKNLLNPGVPQLMEKLKLQ